MWFGFSFFLQSWGWFGFSECSNNPLQVLFGSSRIGTIFKLKKIRYKRIFFGKGYSLEKDIIINGQEAERMGTRNGIWYLTASKG